MHTFYLRVKSLYVKIHAFCHRVNHIAYKKCIHSIIRMVKLHVKMHTFHQRMVRSHVRMHTFSHTGGQVACKIHVFYMPDRHIAYKSAQTRAHVSVPPWHRSAAKRQKGRVVQGDGLGFGVGLGSFRKIGLCKMAV